MAAIKNFINVLIFDYLQTVDPQLSTRFGELVAVEPNENRGTSTNTIDGIVEFYLDNYQDGKRSNDSGIGSVAKKSKYDDVESFGNALDDTAALNDPAAVDGTAALNYPAAVDDAAENGDQESQGNFFDSLLQAWVDSKYSNQLKTEHLNTRFN